MLRQLGQTRTAKTQTYFFSGTRGGETQEEKLYGKAVLP
jgi:hypothetical protein